MEKLFVYGTLMLKYPKNPQKELLKEYCIDVTEGYTFGSLFSLGAYPGLVKGNNKIPGEILTISTPEMVLRVLDLYEGYNPYKISQSEYVRIVADCYAGETVHSCWLYYFNGSVLGLTALEKFVY